MKYAYLSVLLFILIGCKSTNRTSNAYKLDNGPPIIYKRYSDLQLFDGLITGDAKLARGEVFNPKYFKVSKRLNSEGNYLASAFYTLMMFPENDYAYYLLGQSTERLGFYRSALHYYLLSSKQAKESCFGDSYFIKEENACSNSSALTSFYSTTCLQPYTYPESYTICNDFDVNTKIIEMNALIKKYQPVPMRTKEYAFSQLQLAKDEIEKNRHDFAYNENLVTDNKERDLIIAKLSNSTSSHEAPSIDQANKSNPNNKTSFLDLILKVAVIASAMPSSDDSLRTRNIKAGFIKGYLSNNKEEYDENCGCPYDKASDHSRCGARSAWSKPHGATPDCISELITTKDYKDKDLLRRQY
jgi:hypothetical protein